MAETIIKYNKKKGNTEGTVIINQNGTNGTVNINDADLVDKLNWKDSTGTYSLVPRSSFNVAEGESSVSIGTWNETKNEGELSIGKYNVSTSGDTMFSIGDGTSELARHNLFEVGTGYTKFNNTLSGGSANIANVTASNLTSTTITSNTVNVSNQITTNKISAVSGYIESLLSDDIIVDNLTVTKAAHFFQLIIDEIKATQGQVIITPASAKIEKVTDSTNYICYWKATDDDKTVYNQFEVDDLVICQTFNLDKQSNLISDSKFTNLAQNWNASNTWLTADYTQASASGGVVSFVPPSQTTMLAQKLNLQPNTQYNLSFEIKQDVASYSDVSVGFHLPVIDTTKPMKHNAYDFVEITNTIQGFDFDLTDEYKRVSITFTTLSSLPSNANLEIYCYDRNTSGNVKTYITNPILTKKYNSNKYYWRKVVSTGTTTLSGESYNYIELSKTDYDTISNDIPEVGDEIVQLGNKTDKTRQAAIIISAYNNQFLDPTISAPSIVQYSGINDYDLKTHRLNVISKSFNLFKGNFTSVNGDDLETQIANNTSMIQQTNSAITTEVTNRINGDKKYFPIIKPFYDYEFKLITEYKDNPLRYYGGGDIYSTPTYVTAGTYKIRLFCTDTALQDIIIASYGSNYPSDLSNYNNSISLSLSRTYNSIKCKDNTTLYEFTGEVTISTAGYYSINFWEDEYLYIPDMEDQFETNYSRITQTASAITMQVSSLSGSVSTIDQKADNILLQVQDCGLNIDEKSITLNGDTNVNGTLTINDEDTGFLLAGSGGTTQISPKSLGGYNVFTAQTTNIIRAVKSYSLYISNTQGDNYVSATWSFTQSFGNVQSGAVIPLTLQATTFMFYNSGTVVTPSSAGKTEYKVYLNDTLIQTFTNYSLTAATIGSFTTSTAGELKIERTTTVYFNTADIQYNPIINGTLSYRIEVPNAAFQLIGYDGIATNFGTNANVYFGTDGAYMKYGNNGLAVTTSGITKWNGSNWIPLNYLNVVRTSSTNYTIPDNVDMVVTTGSADQNVVFPYPSSCTGRVIYVKRNAGGDIKIWCNSTSTTSGNYFLRPGDWGTYETTFWQDSPLNMYISDGQHWIRGYQG